MNRNRFRGNRGQHHRGERKPNVVVADENNPVVNSFREYASELCDKHDRYERIVKLSRDITIESKRLIFLLHTVDVKKPNYTKILDEARTRLVALCANNFASIAKELQDQDPYQYSRAYSAGLQEFIEAWSYFHYLSDTNINDWNELQEKLTYVVAEPQKVKAIEPIGDDEAVVVAEEDAIVAEPTETKTISCLVQPI